VTSADEHGREHGRVYGRAIVTWLVMLAVMTANGALREAVLLPRLGLDRGRQVSSILGACLVAVLAGVFVRRLPDPRGAPLLAVGALWGTLTLAFEFGVGRFVSGQSWPELVADYDLAAGRLWPLVLVTTIVAPAFWGAAVRGAAPCPRRPAGGLP
jgi:hypothetical protein